MRELKITMSHKDYAEMLKMDGIKSKERLLAYLNNYYGLLGTIVDIVFDDVE